jgi:hypothetical protein
MFYKLVCKVTQKDLRFPPVDWQVIPPLHSVLEGQPWNVSFSYSFGSKIFKLIWLPLR